MYLECATIPKTAPPEWTVFKRNGRFGGGWHDSIERSRARAYTHTHARAHTHMHIHTYTPAALASLDASRSDFGAFIACQGRACSHQTSSPCIPNIFVLLFVGVKLWTACPVVRRCLLLSVTKCIIYRLCSLSTTAAENMLEAGSGGRILPCRCEWSRGRLPEIEFVSQNWSVSTRNSRVSSHKSPNANFGSESVVNWFQPKSRNMNIKIDSWNACSDTAAP